MNKIFHRGTTGSMASLESWDAGSIPCPVQWVNDAVLPLLRCRPETPHAAGGQKRKEKKKKKKNKECTEIEERPKDNKENKTKQNKKIQKTTNESNNEMQPD